MAPLLMLQIVFLAAAAAVALHHRRVVRPTANNLALRWPLRLE